MRLDSVHPEEGGRGVTVTIERNEHVADELEQFYREQYCKKCKLSLLCLMGRPIRETFWCTRCKGWWMSEHDIFVRCDGFPGTYTTARRTQQTFTRTRTGIVRERASIDGCPLCDPQGENPMDIVEGFVLEHVRAAERHR